MVNRGDFSHKNGINDYILKISGKNLNYINTHVHSSEIFKINNLEFFEKDYFNEASDNKCNE